MGSIAQRPLAVVTGASSGIGYELAKLFAQNDFDLVVAAEDERITAVANELTGLGAHAEAVQVDLATDEGVDTLYKRLDGREVDFEYDGEMQADVALDHELMKSLYPFCRLTGPANILIMPGLQSANISAKLLRELGGDDMIGPMLVGLEKPVQIAPMTSSAGELVTLAVLAAGGIAR